MNALDRAAWQLAAEGFGMDNASPGSYYDRKRVAMTLAPILACRHEMVLEVGSGSGGAVRCLQRMSGNRIAVGIDSDFRSVRYCVQSGNPASFARADADQGLPFKTGSFDCLLSSEVYEHLHHPETFFLDAHRVLRPGGLLVLTTPNMESLVLMTLRHLPRRWAQQIVLRGGPRQRSLHPEFFGVPVDEDGHSHQREGSTLREMAGLAKCFGFRQTRAATWGIPFTTDSAMTKLPRPVWEFLLDRFTVLGVGLRHILVVWTRNP